MKTSTWFASGTSLSPLKRYTPESFGPPVNKNFEVSTGLDLRNNTIIGWLLAAPLTLVLLVFLVAPIVMIVVVSFWGATEWSIYPAFLFDNYEFLLTSDVTYRVFFNTFKYALVTWVFTLVIGFTVAHYLAFHIRSLTWQIALFLLCTIPFLTSNIIRMISWIPFLGRNGIANSTLISMGVIDGPLEWLLFSDFSVILAFVHLYTLFMVVPIFNTMMRIDKSLIEAAADAGATGWQILWHVIIPYCTTAISICLCDRGDPAGHGPYPNRNAAALR